MTVPPLFATVSALCAANEMEALDIVRSSLSALGFAEFWSKLRPWGWEIELNPRDAEKFRLDYFNDASLPTELLLRATGPRLLLVRQGASLALSAPGRLDAHLRVVHGRMAVTLGQPDGGSERVDCCRVALAHVPAETHHLLASEVGWGVVAELSVSDVPAAATEEAAKK